MPFNILEFGTSLYKVIILDCHDFSENVIFSPLSAYAALSLTLTGCRGNSAKELISCLQIDERADITDFHRNIGKLLSDICSQTGCMTINLANKLFLNTGFVIRPEFLSMCRENYGSEVEQLNIEGELELSRMKINDWASKITQSKIKEILPPDSIKENTKLVIANAIYFKGPWKSPFMDEHTKNREFRLLNGSYISVPMMCQSCVSLYASFETLDSTAISFPFVDEKWRLIILLPNKQDGLKNLLEKISQHITGNDESKLSCLQMCFSSANYHKMFINISLPRFKVDDNISIPLDIYLKKMGVTSIFDNASADLSGISNVCDLYVSSIHHKAVLEVNERGAEAAASTAVVVMTRSLPLQFCADHPFVVAVANADGVPLILGHVACPSEF